jgi:hypothetical protein
MNSPNILEHSGTPLRLTHGVHHPGNIELAPRSECLPLPQRTRYKAGTSLCDSTYQCRSSESVSAMQATSQNGPLTPNFDRGLKIAMFGCHLAPVAAFFVGVARFEGGGMRSQLFTSFMAGTLFAVGTYVGLGIVIAPLFLSSWLRRPGDPAWVVAALPLMAFISTFGVISAIIWMFR